jgi:hypothetical protein
VGKLPQLYDDADDQRNPEDMMFQTEIDVDMRLKRSTFDNR